MQLTIDSKERLEHVLRVVGSFYGVELAVQSGVAPNAAPSAAASRRPGVTTRRQRETKPLVRGARRRGRAGRTATPDVKAVRAWARDNGFQVSDRGRIPNTVVAAYQEGANTSR